MSVVRQQADSFTVKEFVHGFMAPNLPVAIQGVTEDWPCRLDWLHADGSINIQAMESSLGDAAVCVTHTSEPPDGKAEDCPDTSEMTFRQYAGWWRDHTGQRNKGGCSSAGSLATLVSDTPPSVPLSPPLLYMKDFHLNSACPHYKAYHTPPYFQDDWLNEYHDATAAPTHPLPFPTLPEVHSLCSDSDVMVPPVFMTSSQQSAGAPLNSTPALQPAVSLSPVVHAHHQGADPECVGGCTVPASSEAVPDAVATSDYRFLYLGVAGTRTPLHADVFRSFSWSVNVSGRKRWSLLPPQHTHLLYDKFARTMAPHMDVERFSADQHERFANVAAARALAIPYTQEAGEALFVPSGWYHTVENLCDTLSINHNWFNGHNLTWVTDYLLSEHAAATAAIEDCRPLCNSHEEFESLVQRNLAANVGMDLPGVSRLLHHIQHRAEAELCTLASCEQSPDGGSMALKTTNLQAPPDRTSAHQPALCTSKEAGTKRQSTGRGTVDAALDRYSAGVYSPAVLLKAFVQEVGEGLASVTSLHLRVKNSGTSSVTLAMLWEAVAVLLGACTKLTCFSYTGHTLPLAFLHTLGAVCPLMTTFNTWARTNDGQNLQDVIGLLPSVLPQLHSLGLGSGPLPNMSGNTSVRSLELYCFDFKASSEWLCLPPQLRTLKCDNVCVGPPAKSLEGNASLQSLLTLIVFNRAMSLKTLTEMLQAAPALQEIQIDGHCPEDASSNPCSNRAEFGMALQAHDTLTGHSTSTESPSVQALSILFLASAIPFIVFGFLDNSIMLVAGEEIDARLGVNLGITMLASAGLGNTLADVIGVGVSTSIEVGVGCCRSFRNDV
ncbi:MAG: hypothetical protein WDW38_009007 [Sanguina aurantia]